MPRSAWLLATALTGAALFVPPVPSIGLGIGSARAATGYHTRKKVNGRWVTGKFRDKGGAGTPAATAPAADTPAAGAVETAAPAGKAPRRIRFSEKGLAKTRYSSLPKMKAKVVLKTETPEATPAVSLPPPAPLAQVPASQVPPVQMPPAQMPPAKAPAAAAANAELPPDRVLSTASINPAPLVQPGAERMRSALEARARTMASQLGHIAVPLPDAAPAARLTARSVTYDMGKGTRTIEFDDGATVTAPFDRARAETLNGLPGSR